jgi:hypothetical protein
MAELFSSGRIVDLVLGFMAIEALILANYRRRTGRGIRTIDLLASLAAGACMLLALRAALTGQSWIWVAAALSASLIAHLFDLSRRWKRS